MSVDYAAKTEKLKQIILEQYPSIRAFAKSCNIPQGTLVSALNKGIDGMSYDRVFRICECLHIDMENFDPILEDNNLDVDTLRFAAYYMRLNQRNKEKTIEYMRDISR